MGFGALVWMPLIRVVGKRPGYLASLLFLCATNIWGFYSTTFGSLLASRVVGGFLTSAADAPVPSAVADLFFFHERGHVMMFFNLAISSGAFLGPLANAYITQYWGWKWICGVMAILSGATFLLALLLVKETAYVDGPEGRDLQKPLCDYAPKRTWTASLGFSIGYDRNAHFIGWVKRTVVLVAYPPVVIAGLVCGLFIGWYVSGLSLCTSVFLSVSHKFRLIISWPATLRCSSWPLRPSRHVHGAGPFTASAFYPSPGL